MFTFDKFLSMSDVVIFNKVLFELVSCNHLTYANVSVTVRTFIY